MRMRRNARSPPISNPVGRQYKVRGVIGRGSFGTVYRADQLGAQGFSRPVALKVLNEGGSTADIAERLRDEARLLGLLRHRAIVQVDGLVALDGRWAIVMEFIDGVDLRRLTRGGPVPAGCALEIIGEVASALHVAQTQPNEEGKPLGLLHRDLKPSNILLTRNGEVKVVDFGVARADYKSRKAKTVTNMTFGSPTYAAPERMMAEDLPAGDVYSLGVVLYDLLGATTFPGGDLRPQQHATAVDGALAKLPEVPEPVMALLRELLQHKAKKRPTARELERQCKDIRKQLDGPWLRDWAEEEVDRLPVPLEDRHDFSTSLLFERQDVGDANATIDPTRDSFAPDSVLVGYATVDATFEPDEDESEEPAAAAGPGVDSYAATRLTQLPPRVPQAEQTAGPSLLGRLVRGVAVLVFVGLLASLAFVFGMGVVGVAWALFQSM